MVQDGEHPEQPDLHGREVVQPVVEQPLLVQPVLPQAVDFVRLGRDLGLVGSVVFADGGTDALLRTADWPAPWRLDLEQVAALFRPPG